MADLGCIDAADSDRRNVKCLTNAVADNHSWALCSGWCQRSSTPTASSGQLESLYILHPRTCIPTRCDHSCWFLGRRAYALKCTGPREWALQLLAHDRKILDWSASHPSCNALPRRSVAGSDTPTSTFLVVIPRSDFRCHAHAAILKGRGLCHQRNWLQVIADTY